MVGVPRPFHPHGHTGRRRRRPSPTTMPSGAKVTEATVAPTRPKYSRGGVKGPLRRPSAALDPTPALKVPKRPTRTRGVPEFAQSRLVPPQHQHRGVERLVGQGQARRCLPGDVGLQAPGRLSVREASRAWSTMTEATTSAGTDGRPRPLGNRSANISSGNRARRCSTRKAATEPSPNRCRHSAAASRCWRSGWEEPCILHWNTRPPETRALSTDCSAVS